MIREANKKDKKEIYEVWKHAYPNQNQEYLYFYFKNVFDKGTCILLEHDNRIVSSLQINEHIVRFHGRKLKISYIMGVSTLPDYRRRGYMRQLMQSAIDEASRNHLITVIQAFNPKLYEQFGFETVYFQKTYTLQSEHFFGITTTNVFHNAQAHELASVYRKFIRHFDGYYVRDVEYFETLLNEIALGQKKLLVYRNRNEEVTGYLIYQEEKDGVDVKELIYLESVSMLRLLKVALDKHDEIHLDVSMHENLDKLFPLCVPRKKQFMMVRINNYELFNKLYNANVKTSKEAYALTKKPLWLHEYY